MKIAILGGTGNIGKGFALRWSGKHDIIIGSRDEEKAKAAAAKNVEILKGYGRMGTIEGADNKTAAEKSDIILLAIRYENIPSVIELIRPVFDKQIVISVVVPMAKNRCYIYHDAEHIKVPVPGKEYNTDYFCYTTPPLGSAAQEIAALLPENIELTAAFHNVPARKLADLDHDLDYDIAISGNCTYSKDVVFDLVREIPNMRPFDVGPIDASAMIESLTPLLINIAARNKLKDLGIRFV